MRTLAYGIAATLLATALHSTAAIAQPAHHHAGMAGEQLGELSFPNSGSAAAQAPFLRGVKLLHNFQYPQAIEAFRAAQKADPAFALAYWGEAMAHNWTLWAEQQTDDARAALAKLGPDPDARSAKARTQREKMWLGAVEALYGPGTKFERDNMYADRMDALFAAYPDDLEARVFDALATMGRSHSTRDTAGYMKAAAMLEEIFSTHRQHPGIVHYLIHAYDDPAHAPLGLRAARIYDKIAPSSAHAQHMTSHIFLAMGMWPEAERANLAALAVMNSNNAAGESPEACGHGAIWLVYSMLQESKDASSRIDACRKQAESGLRDPKDLTAVGFPEGYTGSYADMLVRQGLETGRWLQPITLPAGKLTYARFLQDYGRLLASRRDPAGAASALVAMRTDQSVLATEYPREFPDEKQMLPWAERAVAQGEAVVALAQGRTDDGLEMLRKAAAAEATLPAPFGPPALQKPTYEMLGDELLALGRKQEAAEAYRAALAAAPGRRLSLRGLEAATGTATLASKGSTH